MKCVSQYNDAYIYVISNTQATFEAQFMKKLSNTEAELRKSIAYKKSMQAAKIFKWGL